MNRFDRIGWRWAILLSLVLLAGVSRPAWAEDKKPVHLDIRLPEDAELEVEGYKTNWMSCSGRSNRSCTACCASNRKRR